MHASQRDHCRPCCAEYCVLMIVILLDTTCVALKNVIIFLNVIKASNLGVATRIGLIG